MPRAHPPEFRHRAVELAHLWEKPIAPELVVDAVQMDTWRRQPEPGKSSRIPITGLNTRPGRSVAAAIFERIEAWYNPRRRHSYCRMLSPIDYETAHAA